MNLARPEPVRPGDHGRCAGFSLVETTMALVLAVLVVYSVHATLQASIKGQVGSARLHDSQRLANDFLARLRHISFGLATDPPVSALALDELFDDDDDFGPVTLHQVVVGPTEPGLSFTTAIDGVIGRWRIKVDRDLDGDGIIAGDREGRDDLLHITIWFEDRLMVETLRAADPAFTQVDVEAVYR